MLNSSVVHTHLHEEQIFYLKFNEKGETSIVNSKESVANYSYRQVHDLRKQSPSSSNLEELFTDNAFDVRAEPRIAKIDEQKGNVVIRRLSQLYSESHRPPFFSEKGKVTKIADPSAVPHCINQLGIFTQEEYRSLFITQDFNPQGKYELILNRNGRFQTITVDDRIPVYEKTLEPIWGLSFKNPWELILLKAEAKKLNGYQKVKEADSFIFLESFSNSNWKYFNLAKEGRKFLNYYSDHNRYKYGHIILKTKNAQEVVESGLIPNEASFELVHMEVEGTNENKKFHLTIKGNHKSRWVGEGSVIDEKINAKYPNINYKMNLERDFTLTGEDFLNLFSAAYITARRGHEDYFTGYKIFDVEPNEKEALYLEFYFPKVEGFFDFSIKQFDNNKVSPSQKSRIQHEQNAGKGKGEGEGQVERFLKNKYILLKDHKDSQKDEKRVVNSEQGYKDTRYETYEIEYLKGYNRGDAHFVQIVKGRYLIRLKSQKINKKVQYAINYCSNVPIEFKELTTLTKDERADLIQDAMVSITNKVPHVSLDKKLKSEMIGFGNSFEEVGYGFISVKSKINNAKDILVEVNPEQLKKDGYLLKSKFKLQKEPFAVNVSKGEYMALVLKKDPTATVFNWPSNGINFFYKDYLQK